jgi:hypothetical protein
MADRGNIVRIIVATAFAVLALALPSRAVAAAPDTVYLKDGDRISGTVTGPGRSGYRVTTPYGRLVITKDKIEWIVYGDGREEVVTSSSPTAPAPGHAPVKLELAVTGDSFWQAWDPKEAPIDPALRLLVIVDDNPVAAYLDRQLDTDIPGAVVNTFAFNPSDTTRTLWNRTRAYPPSVAPGRATLKLELSPPVTGTRKLRLKYQANLGAVEDPVWTDLVESEMTFDVAGPAPTIVQINQSRGAMTFGGILRKKRMRGVDSFLLRLATEHEGETTALVPAR